MRISKLIQQLQDMQARLGDVQCVMEAQNWRGETLLTTVEAVLERKWPAHDAHGHRIKDAAGEPVTEPVAFIDWRC